MAKSQVGLVLMPSAKVISLNPRSKRCVHIHIMKEKKTEMA